MGSLKSKSQKNDIIMVIFKLLVLSYRHTTLYFSFFYLKNMKIEVLQSVIIQENVQIFNYGFDTILNSAFFRLFKLRCRVVKQLVKFCNSCS